MISKQSPAKKRARSEPSAPTRDPTKPPNGNELTPEARWRRTAIAAFYRAEARGFAPGRELEDWLEAERELEALDAAKAAEQGDAPQSGAAASGASQPEDFAAPSRKRAASKRSRTTRGATMQARNRGDES